MNKAADAVSAYWAIDRKGPRPAHWLDHPITSGLVNRRISGDPKVNAAEWLKRSFYPKPVPVAISLGCGFGGFERYCISLGIAERFDAADISSGAIERARADALMAGMADKISYSVADLNSIELPPASYDAILASAAVHHVLELEHLFQQCRNALKPGSLFFMNEYIGPSRFQVPAQTVEIINSIISVLPARYRMSAFVENHLVERFTPPPLDYFETSDPSESVRSDEIVATLKIYFDIIEFRPYGGAILHMLLSGIAGNFDETDDRDATMMMLIDAFESILESNGIIGRDFAVIVARPKAHVG